ncbi:transglycosylase SLT domain-containing protein [Candidatus Dojkabacteria bacterium]|nr:transglycosylase SLT domain-containing protein [Candidatus Dojkabacteria bacterium]
MTVLATLVVLGLAIPRTTKSDVDETVQIQLNPLESLSLTPTTEEVKQALVYVANKYGLEESQLLKTSQCESGFRYSAVGKAGEIGVLQYMPSTWVYWNKERGTNLDIHNTREQIDMVVWAWKNNLQSHWSCFNLYY